VISFLLFLAIALALFTSAVFSGSETGLYSLSPSRLDLEVGDGKRGAQRVKSLSRRKTAILITILIGNNLSIEVMTLLSEELVRHWGLGTLARDLVLSLVLTPVIFFFGELLPKDLFRRRPHVLMRLAAPFLLGFRIAVWPLERILRGATLLLEYLARLQPEELVRRPARLEVLGVLAEGRAVGALEPHAEELAFNALALRTIPITRAMIPWRAVTTVDRDAPEEAQRTSVERASFTRLPVVRGGRVEGYVHQLDVLGGDLSLPVCAASRPIRFLSPELSVDRTLTILRGAGARTAVVGTAEAPVGLVTVKDLVEEISGDLGGW
jgi:putative hemolysin